METVELTGSQNLFNGDIDLIGIHEGNSGDVLETLKTLKSDFNGWFKEQIDLLFNTFVDYSKNQEEKIDEQIEQIQEMSKASLEDNSSGLADGLGLTDNKGKKEDKKKASATSKLAVDELNKLDMTISIPFGVLYWKLDSIEKKIGGGKKQEDKGGGVTSKIKEFLKGLAEGASGFMQLSVALIAFAGATLIFNMVDWGDALIGMVAFAGFIGGMAVLSLLFDKLGLIKSFKTMAKASMYMSAALLLFSVSLIIAGNLDKGVVLFGKQILPPVNFLAALGTIALFLVFVAGIALVSRLAGKEQKNFTDFAKASMLMSASLVVFSFALVLLTLVGKGADLLGLGSVDIWMAIGVTALFLVFIGTFVALTILTSKNEGNIKEFTISTLLMTASLVAFSFALVLITLIGKGLDILGIGSADMLVALETVGVFMLFVAAYVGLAILANKFAGDLRKFVLTTMLMSASLLVFAVSLFIVSKMFSGEEIKIGNFSLGAFSLKGAIMGLGFFFGFTILFGALAVLANGFAGQIAIMSGVVMLMSISILLFGVALGAITKALCGESGTWKEFAIRSVAILEGIVFLAAFVAGYAAIGAALTVIGPLVLLTAGILIPMAVSLMLMGAAMGVIAKIMTGGRVKTKEGEETFEAYNPSLAPKFFKAFGDLVKDLTGSFNILELLKGVAKLALLDVASVMILGLAHVLKEVGKVQKQMEENPISPDVFQPFIVIIDQLIQVTEGMGIKGAIALVAAGKAMKDIAETIKILFSVIDKATEYDFNGKDKELFDKAIANMSVLAVTFTEQVFLPTLEMFKGASVKAAKTAESFPLIVNAISGLVDIIQKVNKMDDLDMEKVKTVFSGLLEVMGIIVGKQAGWDKLGLAREKGLVDVLSDAQKKIQKANEVLGSEDNPGPVLQFLKNIGAANTFMGKIIKNDFSIEPINNLVEVVQKISGIKMPKILNEMEKLNTDKFLRLAESLDKVANSLEKIKKNMPDKSSLEHIQNLTGSKKSKSIDTSANLSANSDSTIGILNEIKDTLESWNYISDGSNGRSGIYVSNLDDISVPYENGRTETPSRVIKFANAW